MCRWPVLVGLLFLAGACTQKVYEPRLYAVEEALPVEAPTPLKAHLYSGDVVVFSQWQKTGTELVGSGMRYDVTRQPVGLVQRMPLDSVALLEVQMQTGSRRIGVAGLVVWSVVSGAFTIYCLANPKACFGSCPTFYVATDTGEVLVAEAFSSSVARVLEARDVDALPAAPVRDGHFTLTMRNEAWETHAVRRLRLWAVPRAASAQIFVDPGGLLYPARSVHEPLACEAPEGDCMAALRALDEQERRSEADSIDLATSEVLSLTFPAAQGRLGLVLGVRSSLLSTYLFYQWMGFLGKRAGEMWAAIERSPPARARQWAAGLTELIGTIQAEVWAGGRWRPAGFHRKSGPLATHLVVLPFQHDASGPVHIRLVMAKGAWRLNQVALAVLDDPVAPLILEPEVVVDTTGKARSDVLALLRDSTRHLVTFPGEAYQVRFRLPTADTLWTLFLEAEGFYYEWMRDTWLRDEDPDMAMLMLQQPARALRILAPRYKRVETEMERWFWQSRFH